MTKFMYYSINFVALHQENPGYSSNDYLKIGDIDTYRTKYGLTGGYGDPGRLGDTFDYPQYEISGATFVKPSDFYTAKKTFMSEGPDGGERVNTYNVWYVMSVPDDFLLPPDYIFPTSNDVVQSFLSYSQQRIIDAAVAYKLPLSSTIDKLNSASGLYSNLATHMERQLDLIDDALAGKIDAETLLRLSDQAALDLSINLTSTVVGLPDPLVQIVRGLVATYIATQNPSHNLLLVNINGGPQFPVPPLSPVTSIRQIGSEQNDEFYDYGHDDSAIVAGLGNDIVHGNIGSGILIGGTGIDTLSYGAITADLNISMTTGVASSNGANFIDKIAGFENAVGGQGANQIDGSNLSNILDGRAGSSNVIRGFGGNDALLGGAGTDQLDGGVGSDTAFYSRGIFDPIRFTYTGLVLSLVNPSTNTGDARGDIWTSIENLSGSDAGDAIYGNALANVLTGNQGNDSIFGGGGNDTLNGGAGKDRLSSSSTLTSDRVILIGGADSDALIGGIGRDTASYAGAAQGVTASLASPGSNTGDAKGDAYSSIEDVTGSSFGDILIGNAAANVLDGAGGADQLRGGAGSDAYMVNHAGDIVDESIAGSNGSDTVLSLISFSLSDALHAKGSIENVTLTGSSAINAAGNGLANILNGNGAANTLNGAGGADQMRGGAGNDVYVVENVGDIVDESISGSTGTDMVLSFISLSLSDTVHVKGSVENLTLTGAGTVNATGNALANTLIGNAGVNILNGMAGNDTLNGGAGKDFFLFNTALNASTNVDTISGYSVLDDTIRLENAVFTAVGAAGALSSGGFFAGAAAHDSNDRIIYNPTTGALSYDSNGNAAGGAVQFAKLSTGLALTAADFQIV